MTLVACQQFDQERTVPTGPDGKDQLRSDIQTDPCDPSAVILPEECENQVYTPPAIYYDSTEATGILASTSFDPEGVTPVGEASTGLVFCPRSFESSGDTQLTSPTTGWTYQFHSGGTFIMDLSQSALFYWVGQAVYNWPAGPNNGWWTAWNVTQSRKTEIFVAQGRGICTAGTSGQLNISIIRYYGVEVRDEKVNPVSDGSSGGSGTLPNGCRSEYVVIEVDYGDGIWHEVWRGYAIICE
jgi:hypothetical protein